MADDDIEGNSLTAIVGNEIAQAQTFDQTKRTLAIEYMRGEMNDLPARPNGTSQTSRDTADTISWMLPGIVRVFTASDQMVNFDATQPGGEEGAEEASEYTNYSFFRENEGYKILYSATYDSLLVANGAACSYWCPEESKAKLFRNKSQEEIAYLLSEGWQPIEGQLPKPTGGLQQDDPLTGQPMDVPLYTVRLKQVTERGQIKDMVLKPENLLRNASALSYETARFTAYLHDEMTRSDLMGMADEYGWDKQVIENLPRFSSRNQNQVQTARNARQTNFNNDSSTVKSGDIIDLYECYIYADADGDGEAEHLQVWYAGNAGQGEVLSFDEWEDDVPWSDIPCYPIPHSLDAESVFDRTADIQRVKTLLLRAAIDNTYAVNLPMREVEAGTVENPDILVHPIFGGIVWRSKNKNATNSPITPHETPYIADKAFAALEYMDLISAKRTGVSKTTMALDPEALQNQTATSQQLQHDASYSQIELVARNMAELGWTKFFAKRRNLAKKYIKQPIQIPSKNGEMQQGQQDGATPQSSKYRTIQPEQWSDDMACTINVGLGTGSRDRDMSMLNLILNQQIGMATRLGESGFVSKAIEFTPKIRKTAVEMAEASGLKNPDDYFPDITDDDVKQMQQQANQPQPNGEAQLLQLKMQGESQSQQSATQIATIRGQAEMASAQSDLQIKQLEVEQAQRDAQYKDQIAGLELQLQAQKVAADNDTKLRSQALAILGDVLVAGINKGAAVDQAIIESYLERAAGIQTHQQNLELATHQASLAPEPGVTTQ